MKASARLTLDVIRRSGRTPDAAVLIGGGANIPLVTAVMESWLDIPVIVPSQPELVAAEGAALLARPDTAKVVETAEFAAPTEFTETVQFAPQLVAPDAPTASFAAPDIRQETETPAQPRNRRRLLLAGGAVVVAAAIGLGVDLLQSSGRDPQPTSTHQETQEPPAQPAAEPRPTTTTDASPAPETVPAVSDEQSTAIDRSETRSTYRPQTTAETSAQVPITTGAQDDAAADTSVPSLEPEPAPMVPGLPQFELPPPPQIQLPQLPSIPGF